MPDQELQLNRTLTVEFRTYSVRVGEARRSGENRDGSLAEELKSDYHTLSLDDISSRYNTSIKGGLDGSSAANRLARNGKNVISPPPSNYFKKFIDYTFGGFSTLLWIASIICFLAYQPLGGDAPDPTNLGLAILLLIVIFIQIFFNAYQDYSSSKVMASINNMLPSQVIVSRDSKEVSVPTSELVLGDLVHIKYGNKIPADLRIIQTSDLKLDKSVLTGEVEPVNCTVECTDDNHLESKNIALMGTLATNGQGLGIVVATGDKTVMGKIAKLSSTSQQKMTLLQLEIQRFVYIIAALSLTTASLVMILWGSWLRVKYPTFLSLSAVLVNAISVLVAFVPEGLPVAVTLTLTLIARRMAANNVLVKNLTTVETLGSVNVIASDKTGTLTQNRMTVTTAVLDKSYSLMESFNLYAEKCPQLLQMIAVSGLCNGASFDSAQLDIPIAERKVNGDATDSAILRYAEEFIPQLTQMDSYNQLQVIPFNSKNKWMLSLYRPKNTANPFQTSKRVLMMKGAPDVLIPHCKYILTDDGKEVPFDEAAKKFISDEQIRWSSQGQRVLMLTRAILDDDVNFVEPTNEIGISSIVSNLTIIGLLGIIDPPRDQIPETIVKFKSAGIRIFMVTGDFALTAAAIARQIGILTSDDNDDLDRLRHRPDPQFDIRVHGELKSSPDTIRSLVLTGTDINTLTDEDWSKVCSYDEIVFARTTPEQKLKIVQELQARDNIVGVTGDGVNDSPALKCANIGIAMGGGSEVAMEAAHMVLLDNNFTSIVTAIESGRLVFDNLKKVILYLLPAGSFSEMVPILINAILGVPLPLSPFLMIVICVLTDMISSLAIMCEKPESDLLLRPPRRPKQDRLVNFKLLLHAYGFIGIQETLYAHIAYFTYMKKAGGLNPSDLLLVFDKWTGGYLDHTQEQLDHLNFTGQTIFFVTLVIMQCCGNLFSTRTRKVSTFTQNPAFGPTKNPYVILSIIGSIFICLIVVYVPFFNNVFKTRPIPLENWFIPIGFAMLILIVEEFRKLMVRKYPRSILGKLAW